MERRLILHVEDDVHDVKLVELAFEREGLDFPVQRLSTGREAIAYLKGEGKYGDRHKHPIPALVLLDLKLPYLMGLEVLAWIRGHPQLRRLLVFMLSSSYLPQDIASAYDLHANAFLVKPGSFTELKKVANMIQFCLENIALPPLDEPPMQESPLAELFRKGQEHHAHR